MRSRNAPTCRLICRPYGTRLLEEAYPGLTPGANGSSALRAPLRCKPGSILGMAPGHRAHALPALRQLRPRLRNHGLHDRRQLHDQLRVVGVRGGVGDDGRSSAAKQSEKNTWFSIIIHQCRSGRCCPVRPRRTKSRGYALGAFRIFGATPAIIADTTSHSYNAELVVQLTPVMQSVISQAGTQLT